MAPDDEVAHDVRNRTRVRCAFRTVCFHAHVRGKSPSRPAQFGQWKESDDCCHVAVAVAGADVGCWMLDVGCWMLDVGCWNF